MIRQELQIAQKVDKDLGKKMQERATDSTAAYVESHMIHLPSMQAPMDVLALAISEISLEGSMMEFGVYSGKSINFIADQLPNKVVYGFDSFEGLKEHWQEGFEKGAFDLGGTMPEVRSNVNLIKGWFNESLPAFIQDHEQNIAFLHIDCDLYSSAQTVFNLLKNYIVKGTIIVFDEYFNYPAWQQGEFKAFQEFIAEQRLKYSYLTYNRLHQQVAVRIEGKQE